MDEVEIKVDGGDGIAVARVVPKRQLRLALKLREFDLPPIRDGVVIGRRAPIGPVALFDAVDRMLPGMYELVSIEAHPVVEAVIFRKCRAQLVDRDRLVEIFKRHAESLMSDTSIVQVELEGELSVRVELEL